MIEERTVQITKKDLHDLIDSLNDSYNEKLYKLITVVTEPTTEEIIKWWEENIDSKGTEELGLTEEELKRIKDDEIISWDELKKELGYSDGQKNL
jgi:hypothetical protein